MKLNRFFRQLSQKACFQHSNSIKPIHSPDLMYVSRIQNNCPIRFKQMMRIVEALKEALSYSQTNTGGQTPFLYEVAPASELLLLRLPSSRFLFVVL